MKFVAIFIFFIGGIDSTDSETDSVEAWDLFTDEIIEFSDPEKILPGSGENFIFEHVNEYQAIAVLNDGSLGGNSSLFSFNFENGWTLEHPVPETETTSGIVTDFGYFHCNYETNEEVNLPFEF